MLSGSITTDFPKSTSADFDYYRATFQADYFDLLEVLAEAFPSPGFVVSDAPPIRHFGAGVECRDSEDVRVFALHKVIASGRGHLIASGFYSDQVVKIVREMTHAVARLDVKLDLAAPGLFARLDRSTVRFAAANRLGRQVIRNDDPDKGSTIYLGSRQSAFFVRIYQVGLKRAKDEGRAKDQITLLEAQAVRIELEYKPPKGPDKVQASRLSAEAVWGACAWTAALYKHVLGLDVERVFLVKPDETDLDRALRWMCHQYAGRLRELMSLHHGDLEAFGADIFRRIPLDRDSAVCHERFAGAPVPTDGEET